MLFLKALTPRSVESIGKAFTTKKDFSKVVKTPERIRSHFAKLLVRAISLFESQGCELFCQRLFLIFGIDVLAKVPVLG